jgi:hypothetical protein
VHLLPSPGTLEATLPPFVPGRDRPVHFEPDGTIVYDKTDDDWEPPRSIDGYLRDPDNKWHFTPLWPPCIFRSAYERKSSSAMSRRARLTRFFVRSQVDPPSRSRTGLTPSPLDRYLSTKSRRSRGTYSLASSR